MYPTKCCMKNDDLTMKWTFEKTSFTKKFYLFRIGCSFETIHIVGPCKMRRMFTFMTAAKFLPTTILSRQI